MTTTTSRVSCPAQRFFQTAADFFPILCIPELRTLLDKNGKLAENQSYEGDASAAHRATPPIVSEFISPTLLLRPSDASYFGETPWHTAARRGHVGAIDLLAAAGSNPNIKAWDGSTPLHHAAAHGMTQACSQLLALPGAQVDPTDRCHGALPFLAVVRCSCSQGLDRHPGADALVWGCVSRCQRSPLWLAASMGHVEATRFLLERGANPHHYNVCHNCQASPRRFMRLPAPLKQPR